MKISKRLSVIIFIAVSILATYQLRPPVNKVSFWISSEPTSADPLEYDSFVNGQVFTSTFSTLVSTRKRGEYIGILAKTWTSENNFKTWKFELRENMVFENGEPISPEIILHSLSRIGFLIKKRKSKEGLISNLTGFEALHSPTSKIKGIQIDSNVLTFSFVKPMPQALDLFSFGLYAIVHPSDYNKNDGSWKNIKHFVSSGPYRLESWNATGISLALRKDYLPLLGHKNKFSKISVVWEKEQKKNSDIYIGPEFDEPESEKIEYNGGVRNFILYLHCYSWNNKKSPFYAIENRRLIRDTFYANLNKEIKITSSFLPLAISGVSSPQTNFEFPNGEIDFKNGLNVNFPRVGSNKFKLIYSKIWTSISSHHQDLISEVKIPPPQIHDLIDPHLRNYAADIGVHYTDLFLDIPEDDIRFMFFSKEGIRLPDSTGEIKRILHLPQMDFQLVNKLLWSQAIIWPISHFSYGVWSTSKIDISQINYLKGHFDFFWLGGG